MFDNTNSLTVCKETISSIIVFVCQSILRLGPNGLTEFCDDLHRRFACLHDRSLFVGQAIRVSFLTPYKKLNGDRLSQCRLILIPTPVCRQPQSRFQIIFTRLWVENVVFYTKNALSRFVVYLTQ